MYEFLGLYTFQRAYFAILTLFFFARETYIIRNAYCVLCISDFMYIIFGMWMLTMLSIWVGPWGGPIMFTQAIALRLLANVISFVTRAYHYYFRPTLVIHV